RRAGHAGGRLDRLGLARLADRRVGALSQGERRRVALARALLLDPELVVLDEPLTHLDPGAVAQVLAVLRDRAAAGAAVLLSSHQLEHVERVADALVMLHRGRVVRAGETASLLAGTRAVQLLRATPADRARAAVERLEEVESVETAGEDGLLRVVAARPCADRIGEALRDEGLVVSFLAPERRSLDELFHAEIRAADRAEAAP
ncbi:MAG: ATP-binding cassette domain-containing protein, partial [Planctomycetota bacterium JB042]